MKLQIEPALWSVSKFCFQIKNSRTEADKGRRGCHTHCTQTQNKPSRLGKVQAIVLPRILSISLQLTLTARTYTDQKSRTFLSMFLIQLATGVFKKTLGERIFRVCTLPMSVNLKASANKVNNLQGNVFI